MNMTEQAEQINIARLAAIDLGSNSFHMVVARLEQGELKPIEIMSEKVQLAAGLNENKQLSDEAQQRGLDCLSRFAQRIEDLPRDSIRIVGTNSLREARNADEFIEQAERILGISLEVIAGREEARLIFLGVSHTQPDSTGNRLVIDIGGGSTECIIGERFDPIELESLYMGCVSYTKRFFNDGTISKRQFSRAKTAAMLELRGIQETYLKHGWSSSVGSSGTVKAIRLACVTLGFTNDSITNSSINSLRQYILSHEHSDQLKIDGIKPERCALLPAGVAILSAIFESLQVSKMDFSAGALREGLLYEMAGRLRHEDVRERTASALLQRYHVDPEHASRVENTALFALAQVKKSWGLLHERHHDMLSWAALCHEIGLTISHSQFHKHSAYLLLNSDLPGFTKLDQLLLATLVRGHRRKFPTDEFRRLPTKHQQNFQRLCLLLRFAVVLHRNRALQRAPAFTIEAKQDEVHIEFPSDWLESQPLTLADLERESELLNNAGFKLTFC